MSKKPAKKQRYIFAGVLCIVLVLISTASVFVILNNHKSIADKQKYVDTLKRASDDSKLLDNLLYDTAARYAEDSESENKALNDMAEARGEIVSHPEDAAIIDTMLQHGQVIVKAVCQCNGAFSSRDELFSAYDAAAALRTDTAKLDGRIKFLESDLK